MATLKFSNGGVVRSRLRGVREKRKSLIAGERHKQARARKVWMLIQKPFASTEGLLGLRIAFSMVHRAARGEVPRLASTICNNAGNAPETPHNTQR